MSTPLIFMKKRLTLEKSRRCQGAGGKNGALSACARLWQFPGTGASKPLMRRASILAPAAALVPIMGLALGAAAPPTPPAVPGGLIGTLELGKYTCELPGDAGGPVRVAAKDFDFVVIHGSSYRAAGSRGSYLLTGDVVTMTGGKLRGLKLHRISAGFLRQVAKDGSDGDMRCVLGTAGNS
jgi:hypothetical protein